MTTGQTPRAISASAAIRDAREPRPSISVVIPSVGGWNDLLGCLQALHAQSDGIEPEIIVADRVGESVRGPLRIEFPGVRLIEAPTGTTIPALRRLALAAASGDVVGVIEDHVIVSKDWAAKMLAAHHEGHEVVGGSVENAADERLVDWAAFLCEYSHCLVPPEGSSSWLTGNNVTYRRELLERHWKVIEEEGWENRLHDAVRETGVALVSRPDIRVGHKKHYTLGEYLEQRYLYARSYAGMRTIDAPVARRVAYGIAAFALPPLLFYRVVRRVIAAKRHRFHLVRSLPLLVLFVTAWAAGEVVGYWFGGGDSLARVC